VGYELSFMYYFEEIHALKCYAFISASVLNIETSDNLSWEAYLQLLVKRGLETVSLNYCIFVKHDFLGIC
jgi:hypothetical protein